MLTGVLILNLLLAGLCWYGVWRIWQLRQALVRATSALTLAERSTHHVLHHAPDAILQGQSKAYELRGQYQQVLLQLQTVKQILTLLGLGQFVWRQYTTGWQSAARAQRSAARKKRNRNRRTTFV
jgi:hypothetical protein